MQILSLIYEKIITLLWPEVCPFCGRASRRGICDACREELEHLRIREPRCMRCGKPIRLLEQEYCYDCMHTKHFYDSGLSLWVHRKPVSTSIYQFKYHNQRRYGTLYAEELLRCYRHIIKQWSPDLIIPIPIHRKRRRARGYNQAEEIARELSIRLQIPMDAESMVRRLNTRAQKTLGHTDRRRNLKYAFALRRGFCPVRTVLLIDDIYTTGSTIDAAAGLLKRNGVEKVHFLTISIGQGY